MNLVDQEEKRKQYSQAAAIDAQRYNKANEGEYSPELIADADDIRNMLDSTYQGANVYRNCRQKYITVTVNQPGQNRYRAEVREINQVLESRGVIIKKTKANNFVYQMPGWIVSH